MIIISQCVVTRTKILVKVIVNRTPRVTLLHSAYTAVQLRFLLYFPQDNDMKITGTMDTENHAFLTSALIVSGLT